jgi:hypothetical protein
MLRRSAQALTSVPRLTLITRHLPPRTKITGIADPHVVFRVRNPVDSCASEETQAVEGAAFRAALRQRGRAVLRKSRSDRRTSGPNAS